MFIHNLAIRNILRRPKQSLSLFFIMMSVVSLLFGGNAAFDGTSAGLSQSFLQSFTGDLVVRAKDIESYSLFGNETPSIGEFSTLPELLPYEELKKYLYSVPQIVKMAPQVSGIAYLELSGFRVAAPLFGISGESYFAALDGISIVRGRSLVDGERGILISEARAAEIQKMTGRAPVLGDSVQLTIATESSFRIRALPLVGITRYPLPNATLDRIVLIDAGTLRSLYGVGVVAAPTAPAPAAAVTLLDGSIDSLFSGAGADTSGADMSLDRGRIEQELAERATLVATDASAGPWQYLILRLAPSVEAEALGSRLNREFATRGWPLEAIGWRQAAGSGALFIYWLRIIFNVGVFVVAFAGLIVVVNALVSGVLERKGEIGTMRALGAQRSFIRLLFAYETSILALTAGLLGIVLAVIAVESIARRGISVSNPFLIQLFGGPVIKPAWGLASVLRALVASILMGSLAWVYPVKLALAIEPDAAMRSQE